MLLVVTERVGDVAHDVDAAHAHLVVSLDPADASRGTTWGHAQLRVAAPVARHEGVAVVVGDDALAGVPDPTVVLVRAGKGAGPVGLALSIRRSGLPVLVRVDPVARAGTVLRRVLRPGAAADPPADPAAPAGPQAPDPVGG